MPAEGNLLAYVRHREEQQFLVVLNLCQQGCTYGSDFPIARGRIALSTHLDRAGERVEGSVALRPDEGVIIDREEFRVGAAWVDNL